MEAGAGSYNVETINVSLINPFLHLVCDLLWCADGCCAETTDGDVLADCLLCPFGDFGGGLGPAFDGGPESSTLVSS